MRGTHTLMHNGVNGKKVKVIEVEEIRTESRQRTFQDGFAEK